MVDVESRQLIRAAIGSYLQGEIDNFRFDDILCECRTSDGLVNAIIDSLWYLYDDCTRSLYKNPPEAPVSQIFSRWSRLLQTDIDFDTPARREILAARPARPGIWGKINDLFYGRRPGFASNVFWPLTNAKAWDDVGIAYNLEPLNWPSSRH